MTNQEKNVPELRFPEFDGEWEEKKLGDIGSVAMNKRIYKNETTNHGEIPFYKIGTFGKKAETFISREKFEEYKEKYPYPNKGDILISASGSIGRTVEYDGEEAYYQDSNIVWLQHNNEVLNVFLKYFYLIVKWNGIEGTTIKRLYNKNILNTKIELPVKEEQQKIGEFFSKLDQQIELEEQKLEKLEEQKKGYMQKIFSQELRFKDENGNDYPEWEIKKLMQIAKVKTGSKNVQDNIQDGKYKFFDRSVEVKYLNTFDFDETAIIYPGEGSKFLPRYFSGKYSLHQRAYSIYDININNNYLYYYLSLQNNHFLKYAVGSTVKSLRMSGFDKLKVMVPKNSEQEKIGSFFKNLDEFIEKQANKVELLKKRKQSFLQKMFV